MFCEKDGKNDHNLLNREMECLVDRLGLIEAEHFIYLIKADQLDYTKWQQNHFDQIPNKELDKAMLEYAGKHPFQGDSSAVI